MPLSPMLQHYLTKKEEYKDCLLFYRVGDFFEMYFEDAVTASRELELVLTHKSCGLKQDAPMCGVPYHAVETYLARLIEKGHKVAIAEQLSDPAQSKGLVERDVIRVVTPGTVISPQILSEKDNNFLLSVYVAQEGIGLCWTDISTGEFSAMQLTGDDLMSSLSEQLVKIRPKEIITNVSEEERPDLFALAASGDNICISGPNKDLFKEDAAEKAIFAHFSTSSDKGVGLDRNDVPLLFYAVGSELAYLRQTQKQEMSHLLPLSVTEASSVMCLDRATVRNLEICETLYDRSVNGSLFGVLDRCGTAMGSRKMKQWLRQPLNRKKDIDARLSAVEVLFNDIFARNDLREFLRTIYDLERLCGRISMGTSNGKDLLALKQSLYSIPDIKNELTGLDSSLLKQLNGQIDPLTDIYELIDKAVKEDAPFSIREGGVIKDGFSSQLDDLKASSKDARTYIASLESSERQRTGIKGLKVGFNKVFGYYIEISKSNLSNIPEGYIRKQTLVNAERFITEELKNYESIVLNAQTKINELEYRLFNEIRDNIRKRLPAIQKTGQALACIDVLCSFAESSAKLNYVRPVITNSDRIVITKGRHPVIENTVKDGVYVSNDVYMDRDSSSMLIITGPNMSGKSTYMRQLALIVLMAQSGCFVPADSAEIGCCDRIYTRIGASDNLALGQSTFFVEMSELAYILNTATDKSLVILDEIGRGTSTYDGLSIAWAVVEKLTDPRKKIRSLFATHYHELTIMAEKVTGVKNLNVDVAEENGNIVFLHKIVPGSASRSYGIHVAKLAGVPKDVLLSAESKLAELENGEMHVVTETRIVEPESRQISMFSFNDSVLAEKVRGLDLMNMTPSGAIKVLEELQETVKR